jgi:hypothetical protein
MRSQKEAKLLCKSEGAARSRFGSAHGTRLAFVVGLSLLFAPAASRAQELRLPSSVGPRAEGDVQSFGCRLGPGVAGNAKKINDALANRANIYSMLIPAGQLEITEPIVWPARTGYSLLGVGSSKDLSDASYSGNGIGGQASRIVWRESSKAPVGDAMLSYRGLGGTIERIHFQGRPVPAEMTPEAEAAGASAWVQANRKALVGIKVNTFTSGGSLLNSGKLAVRDCSFFQVQTAMLFGPHMEHLGEESYNGDADNHADTSSLENLRFYYPYDDNPTHEPRSCLRVRNNQAVDFDASGIRVYGNPNEIFYFERGGRFVCTSAVLSGASSAANPTTVLRIGKTFASSAWFRVKCDIDGSGGKDRGGIGGYFKLIEMDQSRAGDTYVEYSGVIGPVSYATPIVIARGACTIVLRGVYGLNPKSLQLMGNVLSGTEKRVCNVHLDGCTLRGCDWPSDLVTVADDPNAPSKGPWRLTWTGCTRISAGANSEGYAIPFADSTAATAVESKDVSPGTISGR